MVLTLRVFDTFSPARVLAGMGTGLLLGACSLSFPIQGFIDSSPTGSINAGDSPKALSSSLDREDWRRAKAALAVALDPQGNGKNVAWTNPETGTGGSFVALAPAFPDHDGICRAFKGDLLVRSAMGNRRLKGSACRIAGGDWSIAVLETGKEHDAEK